MPIDINVKALNLYEYGFAVTLEILCISIVYFGYLILAHLFNSQEIRWGIFAQYSKRF